MGMNRTDAVPSQSKAEVSATKTEKVETQENSKG